jgi:hypothetical protein
MPMLLRSVGELSDHDLLAQVQRAVANERKATAHLIASSSFTTLSHSQMEATRQPRTSSSGVARTMRMRRRGGLDRGSLHCCGRRRPRMDERPTRSGPSSLPNGAELRMMKQVVAITLPAVVSSGAERPLPSEQKLLRRFSCTRGAMHATATRSCITSGCRRYTIG